MIKCGRCGNDGHIARDCDWDTEASGRPSWCGECDKDTRLIDHGDYMQRCLNCWAWPAKGTRFHQLFPEHRYCGGCRTVVYEFDASPCGKHQPLGIDHLGRRVERQPPPGAAALAAQARQAITRPAPEGGEPA